MGVKIDPSVLRAIDRQVSRDPEFQRYARQKYHMGGKKLLAKVAAGEGGGRGTGKAGVSSAGARGPFQFIQSTRDAYVRQYGVDPWKNDDQAAKAAIIHIKGTDLAGYNPGMPTYTNYILGQKIDPDSLNYLRGGGSKPRNSRTRSRPATGPTSVNLTGVDNSALRQQLKIDYLSEKGKPGALLNLLTGLRDAEDVPGSKITVPGQPGRPRSRSNRGGARGPMLSTGEPVGKLLNRAIKWDHAGVDYQWGGGHGATARPGQPVDCSGYWSGILNLKTPLTSGQFMSWGKPGPGRNVTIFTHEGHIIGKIKDPRTKKWRWFATSASNKGGGPGEIEQPSAAYLAAFVQRHPGR